ncbi:hypothetical protein BJ912DRAFT_945108 [Pholiota molesta]|nr:hypothetical protein BJ912DRAFT_945108 [Pholiota molesta]
MAVYCRNEHRHLSFLLKGTCRRGKSCNLSHRAPRSAKSPSTPPSTPQKCVYGDKCKLSQQSHREPLIRSNAADDTGGTPQEGEATKKPSCFFFAQGMYPKSTTPSKKKSEPKICKHYVRGSCRAGDACRLKHIQPVDKSSNTDEHIPFSNGAADAEDEMHQPADLVFDDADDIYGDRYDQDEGEDEDEDNGEANTTLTQHEQAASSGYASSRSAKEPSRRGSCASAPSSPAPPVTTPHAPPSVQLTGASSPIRRRIEDSLLQAPCPSFMCARGCVPFSPFLTPEEYTLLFQDPQPNLWTFAPIPVYIPAVTISHPDITENEASAPPTRPTTVSTFKQECKFYRLGTCRNAELCPYEHTQHPDPVTSNPPSARADREWGRSSSRNRDGKFDAPCRFFVEKNYCNRGNDCKFRHDKSTNRVVEEAPTWPSDDNNNTNDDTKKEPDNGWAMTAGTMTTAGIITLMMTTKRTNECNDCRFSHDLEPNTNSGGDEWPPEEPSAPASWVAQPVPCRFFARGNCRRGKDCPDRHDPPEQESPQDNSWPSNSDERNAEDDTAEEHQAQPADDPPPQEEPHWTASWEIDDTPAQIAPGSINKPCKMFAQGFCSFGDECGFKHGIDSNPGPSGPDVTMEAVSKFN